MKSNYIPYIIAAMAVIISLPLSAEAQLKESVEVEGRYEKEILHPDKLGKLPNRLRLTAPQSDLSYSMTGVPAEFVPYPTPIPATNFDANRTGIYPRGYLNLSLGSWLNADLKAGYAVIASADQSLNIWVRHNSTSLWKPLSDLDIDWKRFSYQETIGAEWSRRLRDFGRLDIATRYRFGYFNYYGERDASSSINPTDYPEFFTQTLNDFAFYVNLSNISSSAALSSDKNRWNMGLEVRHFAFRTATRETSLNLNGGYERLLTSVRNDFTRPVSTLGIDGKLQWLLYGNHTMTPSLPGIVPTFSTASAPASYGNLRLSPHYRWANNHVSMRAGFNADLTFNADGGNPADPTGHYSLFHISPDVKFDFTASRFDAWIHASGGQQLMTLAYLADRNLYCYPELQSTTPLYIPIDAQAGFRIKPFSGMECEANFGYRITRNVPGLGWTIPLLYGMPAFLESRISLPTGEIATLGLGRSRYDLKGIYVDAAIRYRAGSILEVEAKMQYSPQSVTAGIFNGDDRPRWILTPRLDLYPVKALNIGLIYEYRGVRNFMSPAIEDDFASRSTQGGPSVSPSTPTPSVPGPAVKPESDKLNPVALRLPDITRLNAHANYTFTHLGKIPSMTIGVEAENLLNRRDQLLPLLPSEGLTIKGNFQILF